MKSPALLARENLTVRYRELYGEEFRGLSDESFQDSMCPAWFWLDDHLNPSSDTDGHSSVLLDPEIGMCMYLLPYSKKHDVQTHISHALKIRSRLLPRTGVEQGGDDPFGSWRVVIHWFVDTNDREAWVKEVSELRGETAHFEELSIDAILNNEDDWSKSIKKYCFHRLLFKTRFVLNKKTKDEVDSWSSADILVEKTIINFPDHFKNDQLKQYAGEVARYFEQLLEDRGGAHKPSVKSKEKTLNSLEIHKFRSIDELTLSFNTKGRGVGAWIIHGPNGTGKSSIYEALSFALCGSSHRYLQYKGENNEVARDKFDKYLNKYLQPLSEIITKPSIVINGEKILIQDLSTDTHTSERLEVISGTMLSQEQSSEFVRMKGSDLGAQIVGDSSRLANEIREYVERRYVTAREKQKTFFERWGLNKNIKNVETAKLRIAEKFVSDNFNDQEQITAWLSSPYMKAFNFLGQAVSLHENWSLWREGCQFIVKSLSKQKADNIKTILFDSLKSRHDIAIKTEDFLDEIESKTSGWDYQLESDIQSWGEWLENQGDNFDIYTPEVKRLRKEQQELQIKQQKVSDEGQFFSSRIDHINLVEKFLNDTQWNTSHGDECPTCSTDLAERDGIETVLADVRVEASEKLEVKRQFYRDITKDLKNIDNKISELGAAQPPIEAERQAELIEITQWLFPPGGNGLRAELTVDVKREQFLGIVSHLRKNPRGALTQNAGNLESISGEMAAELIEAFAHVGIVSAEENSWREIQNKLTSILSTLVDKHLPETLQALWVEISLNLTTARWQLPGEFTFTVDTKRNQPVANVSIDVGEYGTRLARFILNEAEVHVLGLAWFFVKYLIRGRFNHTILVMDDPAQEMDQPAYRELCRLWETFLRLHQKNDIDFKLIVLLHQDERALDAARATGGTLHFLRWNIGKTELLRSTKLLGETYIAPAPAVVLGIDKYLSEK